MAEQKLKLRGCEIVFANMEEKDGFKRSLTIKVDAEKEKQITEFWKANKIGKQNPGVPSFKEYEGTKQMNLSFNDNTKFAYLNGTNEQSLGWGAKVDLIVNAFTYNNKFTGGKDKVGASLSAVLVTSGRVTGADADLADLLSGYEVAESNSEEMADNVEQQTAENDLPF
ncbi:MAG: hypothetical protein PHS04_07925 [Tissierellia bacterium]|nr:hypothetical protein [Tissierellia bacterium]